MGNDGEREDGAADGDEDDAAVGARDARGEKGSAAPVAAAAGGDAEPDAEPEPEPEMDAEGEERDSLEGDNTPPRELELEPATPPP